MKTQTYRLIDLVFNLVILVSTAWAVGYYFFSGPDVLGSTGTTCFRYFTTDSNVLMAAVSAVVCVIRVLQLKDSGRKMPLWVTILRLTGTVAVAVTLLTVVFFLVPVSCMSSGIGSVPFYFADNIFVLHLSTPVLAIVSLLFFDREGTITRRGLLWALLPTVVYSVVYAVLVVFVKVWYDWYGFTFGGKYYLAPVSMIAMYALTYGIAAVLRKCRRTATHE
ncbi:MAG: hypothetical protein MJ192_06365 [Clostridia bacterium]|nr:hypothetical protein [Clostridia bacterium]